MAAVEIVEVPRYEESPVRLRVVDPWEGRRGPTLAQRRASRARMLARRRRTLAVVGLTLGLAILAWPGHAFGGTTGSGLPTDLATSADLASGMSYVVQNGDTLNSIARAVNPLDPAAARAALVAELGSTHVVAGEHVLIP